MNDLGQPPSAAPDPPAHYRTGGLIPPPGAARTWGLTVIGVPLLLVLLLGLVGGSDPTDDGAQGPAWPTEPYGEPSVPDTYGEPSESDTYVGPSAPDTYGTEGTATATGPPSSPASPSFPSDEATATGTAGAGPAEVVTAYFAAINDRDYRTAWRLGGKNLQPDYQSFAAGYATTERDTIDIVSVEGAVVRLVLDALETDGTSQSYEATYTVRNGEITGGKATPIT
ncbi:hypothetical protein [Streptomyces beigongshangae]|uniref:hypothetical protein n=1 Tax=Streptomyces beigongshangae TaxID=2841597 RepID=UPI0021A7E9A3|nr:hypothetical protein [Streptomyces sp. REN17]